MPSPETMPKNPEQQSKEKENDSKAIEIWLKTCKTNLGSDYTQEEFDKKKEELLSNLNDSEYIGGQYFSGKLQSPIDVRMFKPENKYNAYVLVKNVGEDEVLLELAEKLLKEGINITRVSTTDNAEASELNKKFDEIYKKIYDEA